MRCGVKTDGRFQSGEQHPKHVAWSVLGAKLDLLDLHGLVLLKATYRKEGNYRYIDAVCGHCQQQKRYAVDNLLAKKTTRCVCQRGRKYPMDGRARRLGLRYDCMVQRCERETHVSWKDYKGRGIKVLFKSREEFVFWALEKWPDTDFKHLDFDRTDNDGHYEKGNLQLVSRKKNLANRFRKKPSTSSTLDLATDSPVKTA